MVRLFKRMFGIGHVDADSGIKQFCQNEYGKDWYFAYVSYKQDGKFPSARRVI